jgi:hypothetical protein
MTGPTFWPLIMPSKIIVSRKTLRLVTGHGLVAESVAYARGNMEGVCDVGACARVTLFQIRTSSWANEPILCRPAIMGCRAVRLSCDSADMRSPPSMPGQEILELRVETHRRIDEVGSIKTERA